MITKSYAPCYHIQTETPCGWMAHGTVILQFHEKGVRVTANTEFGCFGYYWHDTGIPPVRFLQTADMKYAMDKLTNYNLREPDPDYENLPSAERIRPAVRDFWNYIWLPLMEELRKEQEAAA